MTRTSSPDSERRQQLQIFTASLFSEGDPQAIRLMDEMRRVAHQLYRLSEASLESTDLSYAQYRVLLHLLFNEWLGNAEGLNPSEISTHQGTSRNTISALIRSLEDAGLLARELDQDDRRRFYIRLTEAGRQKIRDHANRHMQLVSNIFAVFTPDEMNTLSDLLQKLNECAGAIQKEVTPSAGGHHASNQ